jgi:hypothetical protein
MAGEISPSSVDHAGGIQAGGAKKITSITDYLAALADLVDSGMSSTELKDAYHSRTAELFQSVAVKEHEVRDLINGQLIVLIGIARAEAKDSGLPPPSDSQLAKTLANYLYYAARDVYDDERFRLSRYQHG